MATYLELAEIQSDPGWADFELKARSACVIKATAILDSATPSAESVAWAKSALSNSQSVSDGVIWYAIGSNSGLTISQILSASDNALQTNINSAVDALYP